MHTHAIAAAAGQEPAGSAGKLLSRLLNSAVNAGKAVRSETEISTGAVSVSSAAVELAAKKAQEDLRRSLSELRVTIVGAGKMARLLLTHLASQGVTKINLISRRVKGRGANVRMDDDLEHRPFIRAEKDDCDADDDECQWNALTPGTRARVSVGRGSVTGDPVDPIHPMVPGDSEDPGHFVTTLYVLDQDESLVALRELAPDEPAPASMAFTVPDGVTQLTPYEFCNQHGLHRGVPVAVPDAVPATTRETKPRRVQVDVMDELMGQYPDLEIDVLGADDLWQTLAETDLAFTATSDSQRFVTRESLAENLGCVGDGEKLLLVDISVPRNVDPRCNECPGVSVYNVDDLEQVVEENSRKRGKEAQQAELLLRVRHAKFLEWHESLHYLPAILQLQKKFDEVRTAELGKATLRHEALDAVDVLTTGIVKKLLNGPLQYLNSSPRDGDKASMQQIEEIFELHQPVPPPPLPAGLQDDSFEQLQKKFETVRAAELEKSRKVLKGLSEAELGEVDALTRVLVQQLIHGPLTYLNSDDPEKAQQHFRLVAAIFQLDQENR
jgi:glutamyl-tRNA reductase